MKKGMFIKLLVMIFVVVLLAGTTGCGNEAGNAPDSTPSTPGALTATETDWPTRPVQLIIPYAPGGDTDTWGRALVEPLSDYLKQTVVATNMPGSSGSVGADYVRVADPDGYTVLFAHNALLTSNIFGQTDFIHTAFENANILVNDQSFYTLANLKKWPTWKKLEKEVRANPGEYILGVPPGSNAHLQAIIMESKTGLQFKWVDIGTAAEGNIEMLAGRVDMMFGSLASIGDYMKTGDLGPLVSYKPERDEFAPDVPTWKELGVDMWGGYLYGTHFPEGTDQAIIDKWNAACEYALAQQEVKDVYKRFGAEQILLKNADATKRWQEMFDMFMQYDEVKNLSKE